MRKLNIEFGECEHEGDEANYIENLLNDSRIASARTIARNYEEEVVVIQVETERLTRDQVEAIGFGE